MATVIDTLIVALGFDASKFTAGVNKAAKDEDKLTGSTAKMSKETDKASKAASNHGKELAQMAGQGVKAFNDMKTAAVQMFASYLTATGIEKLIVNLTAADAKLGRMSQNLGIASAEIKAWSNVAEQSGGSAAGMQNDITSLTKSMIDFKQTGNFSPMLSGIASIGVGIQDAQGHAKSATQIMLDLSDRVKGMSRPDASAFLSNHVGLDEGTINTILQGREALEKQLAAQKENAAAAAANTKKSEELEKATAALKQKFEAVGNELVGRLTPYLIQLAEWLEANSGKVAAIAAVVGTVITAFAAWSAGTMVVTGVLAVLSAGVTIVTTVFGVLSAVMGVVMGVLGLFLSPVGAVIAIIAALAAGIIYAYKHYEKFADVIDRALDWLGFGKNIDGATWSFTKLKDNILDLASSIWTHVKPVFDWLGGVLGKIWDGDFKGAVAMIAQGVGDVVIAAGKQVLSIAADIGNSDAGKAVKQAATNAHAGYREGSTGEKTEGANEAGAPYQAGKAVGKGRSFVFGGGVDEYIKEAAEKYKLDESVLRGFVKMEAGWRGAMSPTGAIGTGQFIKDTWDGLAGTRDGQAIGMTKIGNRFRTAQDPRHDKRVNTLATGLLAKQNADLLRKNGLPVSGENLYMLHNIGPGVITALKGSDNVSAATRKAMNQNGGRGKSSTDFVAFQKANYRRHYAEANGEPAFVARKPKPTYTLPTGVQASRPVAMAASQTRNSTSTSEVHIQNQVINTQATDAKGIARDITTQLKNQMLVSQANTGMSS